ncbi:MAG: EAL domain-containing protein [Burkholderiales bacterium]|nr:EAL domain-containing protein [Burkholderiales bacterium]
MAHPIAVDVLDALNEAHFPEVRLTYEANGVAVGDLRQRRLRSVFQPIVAADGRTIGHAARVRRDGDDGPRASGAFVFAVPGPDPFVVQLDRSCRTLHALNYFRHAEGPWHLFLRVQSRLIESVGRGHGRVFEHILGRLGVPTRDVVIQVARHAHEDPDLYIRALLSYRSLGYRVSSDVLDLDDPLLRGHYDAIPDIVEIDHRWVPDSSALTGLVQLAHGRGTTVLVRCIEDAATLDAARHAGADLLQGYYLGRPGAVPVRTAVQLPALANSERYPSLAVD